LTGGDTRDYGRDLAASEGHAMQAPPRDPSTDERDLIVIPEARSSLPGWVVLVIAGAAAIGLVVGAVTTYSTLRNHLDARDAAIVAATDRALAAEADAQQGAVQIGVLESRVADLRAVLDRSRARTVVVGASRVDLRRQLAHARRDLDRARARLTALAGTSTVDGRHLATIVAVGSTQDPPVIVLDLGRWFTGERARRAAIADGAIDPGDVLPHGRYLRNARPGWRTVPLDPAAAVTVRGWHRRPGVTSISVEDLQQLMRSPREWAERIRHDPFWVMVEGGRVTALREQRYP
jgi:hypothetical protein